MANIKNFGLEGVAADLQLGKAGPRLSVESGAVQLTDSTGSTLAAFRAAPASGSSDVVVKSQLDAVATSVTSLDGFKIALGPIATEGGGLSWTPGAVTLTDAVPVSTAIDKMNYILSLLTPASPPAFPNGVSLTVSNSAGTLPLLASGGVPDNTSGSASGLTAGSSVTRIASSTVSSNTFSTMGPGNEGILGLAINGTAVGVHTLTGTGDNGSYGGMVISGEADYPAATPGFWKSINVAVSGATVAQGINSMQLVHSDAGNTNVALFVYDNISAVPVVSSGSVAQSALGTVAYSSSVPHYGTSGSLTVGFSVTSLSGETYYGGTDPFTITGSNSILSASDVLTYAAAGISTPIVRQTTAATAITPVTVAVNGTTHGAGVLSLVAKNVNGSSTSTTLSSTIILVKSGTVPTGRVDEMNVAVSGLGTSPNSSNAVRVSVGSGDTPTASVAAWTSSAALPTYEAAVVAGILSQNQTNYSTGYLPVGPDLSSGRSGAQYATFMFERSALSTFKIVVTGTYTNCWVKLPGVSDSTSISPNAANNNGGWWNGFTSYNGAGIPGNSGDTSNGCALGTVMTGSSGTFTMTFGTQSSTNATSNMILVRFRLASGQSISSLSFTN